MIKAFIPGILALVAFGHPVADQGQVEQGQEKSKQDEQKGDKDPKQQAKDKAALVKVLSKAGIEVDWKNKIVRASGTIDIKNDFLEYIAVGPRGKKHESLVVLDCKGSLLKAALIAIGFKGGKNVSYKPIVPAPTKEQVEQGAPTEVIVPPSGMKVHLALEWKDDKKNTVRYAIEDLLIDMQAEGPVQNAEWIYFGGMTRAIYRGEPPVFVADYDQNYISNYYTKPDSHLITMKHKRARDDQNWWPATDRLPDRGTPCTLILSRAEVVKRRPAKELGKKKDGK